MGKLKTISIIIIIVIIFAVIGCYDNEQAKRTTEQRQMEWGKNRLPPGSTMLKEYGNGWLLVKFDGNKFLFNGSYGRFTPTITQVRDDF